MIKKLTNTDCMQIGRKDAEVMKMKKTRVVLRFSPEIVEEPITYHLITDYSLRVNILRASIDPGKQGKMIVELAGSENEISGAFDFLRDKGVRIEPLDQTLQYREDRCMDCTACVPVCPTGALDVNRRTWQVDFDPEKCVVCLSCVDACPYRAVEAALQ
jgi:NAD-dependent dihydropyrimidine dehydrogenase PreA subunit